MTTNDTSTSKISGAFRPTARLLQLLGDELIASPRLAVFELVKNAYDADATGTAVVMHVNYGNKSTITVSDDGEGMTPEILQSVWLVPGNNHRQRQRNELRRTKLHNRLPIGEKGLGRFAAHKLGNRINLVTRAQGNDECVVEIDWNELTAHEYLEDALVTIVKRPPEIFKGESTGTQIQVSDLRSKWTRGDVRRLYNQITSMCSPFDESGEFQAVLRVPGNERWIEGLPDVSQILDRAFWKFTFQLNHNEFDYKYEFRSISGINVPRRNSDATRVSGRLALPVSSNEGTNRQREFADASILSGIGPVSGVFYVYDRDRTIMTRLPDQQAITRYLDEFGGVRVYRDGIRVYNYGEQGDDWLGLDLRRVNSPTRRVSKNIVLGALHLSLADSPDLIEKTNREGFVENEAFVRLRRIALGAVNAFEGERHIDKEEIRKATNRSGSFHAESMDGLLRALRNELQKSGPISRPVNACLNRIEHHYNQMRETLLSAGMSGLTLSVIFHEVERGIRSLHQAAAAGADLGGIERQAATLAETLDGFALLLRRNSQRSHSARQLVEALLRISEIRLSFHQVDLVCPFIQASDDGFKSKFAFNLVLGALNNLVDNALYWLRMRWPNDGEELGNRRKLYINVSRDFDPGPAIIVADNGIGFGGDTPDTLVRPFFTRRPDGMGLGLYYASLAMHLQGGRLAFPSRGEIEVPNEFDGAVVALIFKEEE